MSDLLLKGGRASTDTPSSCSPGPLSPHLQEYSGFALKEKKKLFGALKAAWRFHQRFHL